MSSIFHKSGGNAYASGKFLAFFRLHVRIIIRVKDREMLTVMFDALPIKRFLGKCFHPLVKRVFDFSNESGDKKRRFCRTRFKNVQNERNAQAMANENRFWRESLFIRLKDLKPTGKRLILRCRELWNENSVSEFFKFCFEPRKPVFLRIPFYAMDDEDICHTLCEKKPLES